MNASTAVSDQPLLGVYKPSGPVFVRGEGNRLIAENGERYLDFTAGIAVNALGYGDPSFADAVRAALDSGLVHTSNLYRTEPAVQLARWLVENSFGDRVFFCNSGAEANEGAFKFARRWAHANGSEKKSGIVAFRNSFHGRTFGALAATDRPAYQDPFRPLMPEVDFGEVGKLEDIERLIDAETTAAVVIEPIQAEGGVLPIPTEFLEKLRAVCDERNVLLIFDEVQVGLGRTGHLWAHQAAGVEPDLMTLAKPLAGGLPMGAVVLTERVAAAIQPGDHATTFGGGPLVASAALAVCQKIGDSEFLAEVRRKGELLSELLGALALRHDSVVAVRGSGLIWGVEIDQPAGDVVARAMDAKLLVCPAGAKVIRLVPPLTISEAEIREGLDILEEAL